MRLLTSEEAEVLRLHNLWVLGDPNGKRAYLAAANLARANLAGANLARANLARANLARASLDGASLAGASLAGADLDGASLAGANLAGANLARANLARASLDGANLDGASLDGANLDGASLAGADLARANLARASLAGASLAGAINCELAAAKTVICPQGSLVVWKKCRGNVIVKLRIPEDAKRSCASGRKCRAEFADVIAVYGSDVGVSSHDQSVTYVAGSRVVCDKWNEDRWTECGGGIHFFITKKEAEDY